MRALILEDGLSRQALTASRALADAGWTVGIGAHRRWGMAACSGSVRHWHTVPAPQLDLEGFAAATSRAVSEMGYEIVFGARDVDVLALSVRRDEIPACVPYPPHERLVKVLDKLDLNAAAARAGVAVPDTLPATEAAVAEAVAPVMVKARLHATFDNGSVLPRIETRVAASMAEAVERIDEIRAAGGEPLLQEYLPEPRLIALMVVADESSRVVAAVQQAADAVWPTGAGVSVRAHTVALDERLAEGAAALVREAGWRGLAELQYIVPADGEPQLIDFNGRFYGSLALAVGAGVNLPALWAALATGRPLPAARTARPGARFQWLFGDVRRCMDDGLRGFPNGLIDTARYARGAVQSVWSPRDPLPALRHFQIALGQYAGSRLR